MLAHLDDWLVSTSMGGGVPMPARSPLIDQFGHTTRMVVTSSSCAF